MLKVINIPPSIREIVLIIKYGCDGSSGYNPFMQKPTQSRDDCHEEEYHKESSTGAQARAEDNISESNLFLLSFVPLHLRGTSSLESS